jgi:hypothetical protein
MLLYKAFSIIYLHLRRWDALLRRGYHGHVVNRTGFAVPGGHVRLLIGGQRRRRGVRRRVRCRVRRRPRVLRGALGAGTGAGGGAGRRAPSPAHRLHLLGHAACRCVRLTATVRH